MACRISATIICTCLLTSIMLSSCDSPENTTVDLMSYGGVKPIIITNNKILIKNESSETAEKFEPISFKEITNLLSSVEYERKMTFYKMEERKARKKRKLKRIEENKIYEEKLLSLYNEYSNNWRYIPDEIDRYWVMFGYVEGDHRTLAEEFLECENPIVIECASKYLARSEKDFDRSIEILDEGIAILETKLDGEFRETAIGSISTLYINKSLAYQTHKDRKNQIESLKKSILYEIPNIDMTVHKYKLLAGAYSADGNREKMLENLNAAEKIYLNYEIKSQAEEVEVYFGLKKLKSRIESLNQGGYYIYELNQ